MRFFCAACLVGIVVASLGCMTKNWSSPLFSERKVVEEHIEDRFPVWGTRNVSASAELDVDNNAGEIDNRLGFK